MKKVLLCSFLSLFMLFPLNIAGAKQQPDCKVLEDIFVSEVKYDNGACEVEVVRKNPVVTQLGMKLKPGSMDLAFNISFIPTHHHQTAVMGEFALLENEINPVIDELRKGNLEISALHNHMIKETPRILFLHFQGVGELSKQAKAIKHAIERTNYN